MNASYFHVQYNMSRKNQNMQNAQRIAVQIHVEASTHTRPSIYPTAKTACRPFIPGNFSIAKLSLLWQTLALMRMIVGIAIVKVHFVCLFLTLNLSGWSGSGSGSGWGCYVIVGV